MNKNTSDEQEIEYQIKKSNLKNTLWKLKKKTQKKPKLIACISDTRNGIFFFL